MTPPTATPVVFPLDELWLLQRCVRHEREQQETWKFLAFLTAGLLALAAAYVLLWSPVILVATYVRDHILAVR